MDKQIKVAGKMAWLKASIMTTYAAIDAITHFLEQYQVNGVEFEALPVQIESDKMLNDEVKLIFYLPEENATEDVIHQIKVGIKNLNTTYHIPIGSGCMSVEKLTDEWKTAWEKYYKPIEISKQMIILPTWEKTNPQKERYETIIELDPGLAFGTGSHPTTILSLLALEKYVNKEQTIIDIGSGSGILSIAAILLGAREVIAIDNDQQAVKSTKQNALLNDVNDSLTVIEGNLLQDTHFKADLIVANILAEVIIAVAKDAYNCLLDHGYFITSGIIKRKQQAVMQTLQNEGFTIIEVIERDGWVSVVAQKQTK